MSKDKRTEQEIIADIRKDLTGLEQRALTVKQVESSIWKLWGFVRENRNSLDSERCCRMFQGVVNGAVESVTKHAESLAAELDEVRSRGAIIHESRDIVGVTDVVCPIIAGDGRAVACVTVAAVSRRSNPPNFEAMLARLKVACAEIAHELTGYAAPL